MKARIKATGEIINVAKDATVELDSYNKYGLQETYFLDAVEIINEPSEEEWKQAWGESSHILQLASDMPSENKMRYELAKAAMQGMVSFWQASYNESSNRSYGGSLKVLAEMSVDVADEMINELNKKKEENK